MKMLIDKIIAYEQGELDASGLLKLFAELISTGGAWTLQGSYGRTASLLIEQGLITREGVITEEGDYYVEYD
jgi:hypothetical protein